MLQEGAGVHKPLVRLCGETMLDRLVRIFRQLDAEEIILIVNEKMADVVAHARVLEKAMAESLCPLRLVVKTTPSSMHSFFEIAGYLTEAPFCLTTVDSIFKESDFKNYIAAFGQSDADGMMAVTDYVDDEKPLYVGVGDAGNIVGFFDENNGCKYISGGVYCMKPVVMETLKRCIAEGKHRMRNFQRQLIADGLRLKAYPFSKILDVDHLEDIAKAEQFLSN